MLRKITGYHLDEENHWVAELDCYHGQHVRHQPPFIQRPWVTSDKGRKSKLGVSLNCVRCDRLELPDELIVSDMTPVFTECNMPFELNGSKRVRYNFWSEVSVLEGKVKCDFHSLDVPAHILSNGELIFIPLGVSFSIEADTQVKFHIKFYSIR